MKYFLFFILLLLCIDAQSQSLQWQQQRKMSYGLFFSPTINYRTLTSEAPTDLVKEIRDSEEEAALGYRAGITLDYRLTKQLELQFGLILSNRIFKTAEQSPIWSDETITEITSTSISNQYLYLDIPLKLKYNFSSQKRLNWFVSGGINTSLFFLYNRKNHVQISGEWVVSKDQSFHTNPLNFFAEIESGMEYKVFPRLKIRLSANFQYALTSTNSNLKTKEYLYNSGVGVGLIFTPKK